MTALIITLILSAPDLNKCETIMLAQVNATRARRGLTALTVDEGLQKTARAHCRWMCETGRFSHSRAGSENIATGQRSVTSVMSSWMNSRGHRANILRRSTRMVGVCGYRSRSGQTYWVQQFK